MGGYCKYSARAFESLEDTAVVGLANDKSALLSFSRSSLGRGARGGGVFELLGAVLGLLAVVVDVALRVLQLPLCALDALLQLGYAAFEDLLLELAVRPRGPAPERRRSASAPTSPLSTSAAPRPGCPK